MHWRRSDCRVQIKVICFTGLQWTFLAINDLEPIIMLEVSFRILLPSYFALMVRLWRVNQRWRRTIFVTFWLVEAVRMIGSSESSVVTLISAIWPRLLHERSISGGYAKGFIATALSLFPSRGKAIHRHVAAFLVCQRYRYQCLIGDELLWHYCS